jgi:exodeoxyribonuclease V beta subunit
VLAISAALSDKDVGEKLKYLMEKVDLVTEPVGVALCAAIAELAAAHAPILAICAHRFLPEVMARVRATKARRGQFDFQDMLRLVGEALVGERGAELAARLRAMHPWALIDEFQDTDDVQWDIFRTVWADGADTSLAIVGDPKQAIYSFRGADVHTYLRARTELNARGAVRVDLTDNHRSSTELVEAVNALVGGRAYAPFFTGDIRYDAPVRAASGTAAAWPDGRPLSPVHVFEIDAPDGHGKNDAVAATLAERIGDEIHALLSPPPEQRLQLRFRDAARPLRPADIHVLTRSGRQSDEIAVALRARGVPCALFQREHLFDAPEAREVADLLDAIADPRDRSRRLRAWTTSFFAVPLAELGTVIEVPDEHPLIALLYEWRGLALRKDYDALLHRVLDDTRWVERTLVAGGGERAVTNVLHLFELLHDEVSRSRCEIHELAARLRGWIRMGQLDRPDDLDLQRLETDRQAVQVMTIHRAKGLEAAVVFVHGGHTAVPLGKDQASLYHDVGDGGERRIHVGSASGATAAAIQQDVVEENQRLMYVAMTRARVRLYLPVVHHTNLSDTAALAAVQPGLCGALAARATDPESARLFTSERIAAGSLEAPPPVEAAEDLRGWSPPAAPAAPADDPLWEDVRTRRRGAVVTSYSKLKQAARPEEHSAALVLDDRELPAGAATGLFLHDVLEHVAFGTALETADAIAWSARADVAPAFEAAARRHGLDRRHRDEAARMLHRTLTREIQLDREVLPPLARAPRVAKEVEFLFTFGPGLRDDAFARGFIDLLVGWDERVWVVDYKSDVLASTTLAAARVHTHEHYHQQAQLYGVAAARLLDLDGDDACRRRFGGVLYWFLRYDYVVDLRVSWPELGRWTAELARAMEAA